MKTMKLFLVAILTLTLGVTVTSCLKGDDNNMATVPGLFVKVDTYAFPPQFVTSDGVELIPNQTLTSTSKPFAFIYYQYDRTLYTSESKLINITLLADPWYFDQQYVTTTPTAAGNAPIASLEPLTNAGQFVGLYFDKNTLIMPIGYMSKVYDKEEDQTKEKNAHAFVMSYDPATGFANGVLTFTLNHTITEVSGETVLRTTKSMDLKAFNFSQVLGSLSSTPTKINVVVKENINSDKLADAVDKTYSYEYKFTN